MTSKARLWIAGGITYAIAIGVGYGYSNGMFGGAMKPPDNKHPTTSPTTHSSTCDPNKPCVPIKTLPTGQVILTDEERHHTFGKNASTYDMGKLIKFNLIKKYI